MWRRDGGENPAAGGVDEPAHGWWADSRLLPRRYRAGRACIRLASPRSARSIRERAAATLKLFAARSLSSTPLVTFCIGWLAISDAPEDGTAEMRLLRFEPGAYRDHVVAIAVLHYSNIASGSTYLTGTENDCGLILVPLPHAAPTRWRNVLAPAASWSAAERRASALPYRAGPLW